MGSYFVFPLFNFMCVSSRLLLVFALPVCADFEKESEPTKGKVYRRFLRTLDRLIKDVDIRIRRGQERLSNTTAEIGPVAGPFAEQISNLKEQIQTLDTEMVALGEQGIAPPPALLSLRSVEHFYIVLCSLLLVDCCLFVGSCAACAWLVAGVGWRVQARWWRRRA